MTRAPHGRDGKQDRLWPYILAILLLPAMVLWRQDNMFFPQPGLVDGWVYLGLFRNLVNFKQSLFPGLYYGSRLSWILPGSAVHAIFNPVPAYYVLHLTIHYVATLSLFAILRCYGSIRGAFLATLVFAASPLLWYANESDYVDGVGVAYCLLALALLTYAARRPPRRWILLASGGALAALVYTNLFWISFVPLMVAYCAALIWVWNPALNLRALVKAVLQMCLWIGAGSATLSAVLSAINYRIDGNFWFYEPSIRFLRTLNLEKNPWFSGVLSPHGLWPWLWVTVLVGVAALAVLTIQMRRNPSERDQASMVLSLLCLFAMAVMAYVQQRGTPVLGRIDYASFLVPFEFLVIGVTFWPAVDSLKPGTFVLVCCGTAAIFGAIWFDYSGFFTPMWPDAIAITACGSAAIFALALLLRHRAGGLILALAGCAILTAEVRMRPPLKPGGPHSYKREYERFMEARQQIESVRNGNRIRFWYDNREPSFLDFRSLNSTYHNEYSWLGQNPVQNACDVSGEPGDLVVVLSGDPQAPIVARDALSGCWGKLAITPEALSQSSFVNSAGSPWSMTIIRATADTSVRHNLSAAFNAAGEGALHSDGSSAATLPLDRWKEWIDKSERSTVSKVRDGVEVHTPDGQHAWGAMYAPLIAQSTGRYRLALQYKPGEGHFAFGIYAGDSSRWLGVVTEGHAISNGDFEMSLWVNLQQGERILPRIENDDLTGNHPASFVMKRMTALEIDR